MNGLVKAVVARWAKTNTLAVARRVHPPGSADPWNPGAEVEMGVCFPLAGAGDQVALRGANGHCQCAYEAGPFTDSAGEDDRLV